MAFYCVTFTKTAPMRKPGRGGYVIAAASRLSFALQTGIYMAFQIKQKANTHPHALPVFFFTINIP